MTKVKIFLAMGRDDERQDVGLSRMQKELEADYQKWIEGEGKGAAVHSISTASSPKVVGSSVWHATMSLTVLYASA